MTSPVFPISKNDLHGGMSMRDLYAIAAMHGLTQRGLLEDVSEGQGDTEAAWLIADLSYKVADAMLHAAFKDKTDDKTT